MTPNLNDFCSGHLIVDASRKIMFCNEYLCHLTGCDEREQLGKSLSSWFTKASNIFIDSYIYPLLLNESIAQENQLNLMKADHERIAVVAHVRLDNNGISYWSLYVCVNRDKLQSELVNAKSTLEKQSKDLFLLATTDPLTGLLNRRELEDQAAVISYQVANNNLSYAVVSLDVDFFKVVNDTHGHHEGDEVLKSLANLLRKGRRVNDLVARVGGEEFVLLLPNIDKANALDLAQRIRQQVQEHSVNGIQITVSIGLVVSPKGVVTDYKTLHQLSDEAMYNSKRTGRNKVTLANS